MSDQDISNISVAKIISGVGIIGGTLFIVILSTWISHVETSLANGEANHHSHSSRITTLEANYAHIMNGLGRIEESTAHTAQKVDKIQTGQAELKAKVRDLPSLRER